jgi:hypothetical protein
MATVVETSAAGLVGDEEVVDLTTPLLFAMIEAGFFPPERRVFLWGGRLCEKMAKTVAHSLTAYAISEKLRPLVSPDCAARLTSTSENGGIRRPATSA